MHIAQFELLLDNQSVSRALQNAASTHFGTAFMTGIRVIDSPRDER
jgi:hypothetical protein